MSKTLPRCLFICVYTEYTYIYIYIYIHICIYAYLYVCIYIHIYLSIYISIYCTARHSWAMGWWLRWVGSLKLQVSFAKYGLLYRALLQKRPMILRSLLIVASPYLIHTTHRPWRCLASQKSCGIRYGVATISRLLKIICLFLQNIVSL